MKSKQTPLSREDLQQRALNYRKSFFAEEKRCLHLLIFSLEQHWYACSVNELQQSIPIQDIAPLPNMHPAVLGLINLRGTLILTFDLRRYFGMTLAIPPEKIVILQNGTASTGILVERIKGVDEIPEALFRSKIEISTGIPPSFIRGIAMYKEEPLLWLDIKKIILELEEILG